MTTDDIDVLGMVSATPCICVKILRVDVKH